MINVNRLTKGDCIGIFSSSSPTNEEAVIKMQKYFELKGYKTKVAPHTLDANSFMAGKPENRANDLHLLINDDAVNLIMTANGGESAIQMLPFLDFNLIASRHKIICGLSDPTSILNAISFKSNIPTFHGPNGYNFGHTEPTDFTEKNWWKIITGNINFPYEYPVSQSIKTLQQGAVKAPIFGGNLGVLCSLLGTQYFPDLNGKILFIEDVFKEYSQIDTCLTQLRLAGVFEKIVGFIIGENLECKDSYEKNKETYEELLKRNLNDYNFPIMYNIPLGHTDNKITIPIGCVCSMNTSENKFTLVESPFKT